MPKVRIFSTPSCVYCVTLKEYLKSHNISFEYIDVSLDEQALNEMIEKSEQMSVPVIDINGEFIVGFDKKRINELLKIIE
ncbi:glutathione S-transferase N-terminal domain-containing protein [Patescibacteria group bacterium]|nr:glutathione S-transferase N-terminal domain-containing protein [Patescibacteria group bacterium]